MIERVGNGQEYNRYQAPSGVRNNGTSQEHFSLNQGGPQEHTASQEDGVILELNAEERAEKGQKAETAGAEGYHAPEAETEQAERDAEEELTKKIRDPSGLGEAAGKLLARLKAFFTRLWDIIWNSPETEKTGTEKPEDLMGDVPADLQELSEAEEAAYAADTSDIDLVAAPARKTVGQADRVAQMEAFLAQARTKTPAIHSDLLSTYDRNGKMVQVSDKERILHGK